MAMLVSDEGTSVQVVLKESGPTAPNEFVLGSRPSYGTTLFVSRAERADLERWYGRPAKLSGVGEYFKGHLVLRYEPVSLEVVASAVAELAAIAMTIMLSDLDLCGVNVHNTGYAAKSTP